MKNQTGSKTGSKIEELFELHSWCDIIVCTRGSISIAIIAGATTVLTVWIAVIVDASRNLFTALADEFAFIGSSISNFNHATGFLRLLIVFHQSHRSDSNQESADGRANEMT